VLVVCIGRATRLVQYLVGLDKQYIARVKLGFSTDTQDLTGKPVTPLISSHSLSVEALLETLKEFTGPLMQVPPMYSAKKVGGERLYRAARAGREIERQAVAVVIHSLRLRGLEGEVFELIDDGALEFEIEVVCSSGTYIRTLACDLGQRLGTGGHLVALRRTRVGHFDLSGALTLDELAELGSKGLLRSRLISPARIVGHLPEVRLDSQAVKMVTNGRSISIGARVFEVADGGHSLVRLLDREGELVAVGEYELSDSSINPRVVFPAVGKDQAASDHLKG
jgi:tRNA pseudouridine55 synthase